MLEKIRHDIYRIIFRHNNKYEKLFDMLLMWLIFGSLIVVIIDSLPGISSNWKTVLRVFEWFFTIVFTIEFALRIWSTPTPWRYLLSFWGVVDFLSILPSYLGFFHSGMTSMLTIRILRLLRVFRIMKLANYNKEARLLMSALRTSTYKILVFIFSVMSIVVIMGTLMYVVEGAESGYDSIPQGIYWAIVTITTVGFGDVVPQTVLGKFIASVSMLLGYAIIAVPTGIITAELTKRERGNIICTNCGNENRADAMYCNECGSKLMKK